MLNMQNKLSYNILLLVLVSICIIFLQQGEINRDGIMYLSQSQYIVEGNWDKAMKTYNWPFFSILIAGLHHEVTGALMKITRLNIPEVIVIEPEVFEDERGFFFESFNQKKFNQAIGREVFFVQDNHSKSKYGVLRGLHYQEAPFEQA